jgi:hypothetical protein
VVTGIIPSSFLFVPKRFYEALALKSGSSVGRVRATSRVLGKK